MKPDRVVIGAEDARAQEIMLELYSRSRARARRSW
jgi:UDP-glucose 6-dehydrogenase